MTSLGSARAASDAAVSAWSESLKSSVRLVSGGRGSDGSWRLGVEIRLSPGFKTYWRAPGESGIPPVFDWAGSENVGAVSVRWPAPRRYVDDQVITIGYKDSVIFPVSVRAADPAKPVTVRLKLDYAVCESICIPANGSVALSLADVPQTIHTEILQRFRDQVPKTVEPGRVDGRLSLASATASFTNGTPIVTLAVGVPAGSAVEDVFLEGPDGWVFGTPVPVPPQRPGDAPTGGALPAQVPGAPPGQSPGAAAGALAGSPAPAPPPAAAGAPPGGTTAGVIIFQLPVLDRPRNAAGLVPFVATLVGRSGGVEVTFDLDISQAKP